MCRCSYAKEAVTVAMTKTTMVVEEAVVGATAKTGAVNLVVVSRGRAKGGLGQGRIHGSGRMLIVMALIKRVLNQKKLWLKIKPSSKRRSTPSGKDRRIKKRNNPSCDPRVLL
jgi:acyl dehydratase